MKIEDALKFLKCPNCGGELLIDDGLKCNNCRDAYPVIDGVPVLMKKENLGGQEKSQIDWFENHYSKFSASVYKLENWRLSMLDRIFGYSFCKETTTYLDIGCGATGYTVIEAAKRNGWLSFGVDISLEAMVRARALAIKQGVDDKTFFLVCTAENLPFKTNTFDYISAISVLEHLKNDERTVESVSGILKKDGHFHICVPNTYLKMWFFLWPIYFCQDKYIGHLRHYSIEGLNKKLQKYGFKFEEVVYNGHLEKLYQLAREWTIGISDDAWWQIEKRDISGGAMGVQLNAVYQKV